MKTQIQNAKYLNVYPTYFEPSTYDECMAALVGYNLGDGTITHIKTRNTYTASFYGGVGALQDVCKCLSIIAGKDYTPRFKKGSRVEFDSYQVQTGAKIARLLIDSGCIIGKKTQQTYDVPQWIKDGTNNIKRSFISALFGSEGSTPRKGKGKAMAMPVMTMHKTLDNCFNTFFNSLVDMLNDLGIKSKTKVTPSKTGNRYALYITAGTSNIIKFIDNCGYLFCPSKQKIAWLWSNYLRSAMRDKKKKVELAKESVDKYGYTKQSVSYSGMSRGQMYSLVKRANNSTRILNCFPTFNDWVAERSCNGGLRLKIDDKKISGKTKMYNILVNSHDHSYLVADGINNYNCFETAVGLIYADYGAANITDATIEPHEQLLWAHDFNFSPMSSCISVIRNNNLFICDEIVLNSAIASQTAEEFVTKYEQHQNKHILLYGDPAGRAGEKHGHNSDYVVMENILKSHGWQVERRVKNKAPAIKDRQNAVRAKIRNMAGETKLFVNMSQAHYVHKGLSTVELKSGSTFIEADSEFQHMTTAVGYMVDYEWPLRRTVTPSKLVMRPQRNHW